MAFKFILIVASLVVIVNSTGWNPFGNTGFNPLMFGPPLPNPFNISGFDSTLSMTLSPDSIKNMKGSGNGVFVSSVSKTVKGKDGKWYRQNGGKVVMNNNGEVFEKEFGDLPDGSGKNHHDSTN